MELYNHQLLNEKLNIRKHRKHHKQKDGKSATTYYLDDILTFDIEVTSAWLENGKVIPYHKGEEADYWNNLEALSLPYIWQFSINETVYYGREFKDFLNVLDDLSQLRVNCIIWVHNLSYEFAFLCNLLDWKVVFARNPHKPMKAIPKNYQNIEFRCSYMLTRLSLAAWGEQLGLNKMVGDLDYEKLRTPLTKLTEKEMFYCERDCLVVYKGICDYVKKYGNQWEIPLTQTGTVRRVVKDMLTTDAEYVKKVKALVPYNADEYKMLQDIFAGGYTHANRKYAGEVLECYIEHYDFASSYPTVMVAEKYPMHPWLMTDNIIEEDKFNDYAFIYKLKFSKLRSKSYNTYIQYSKVIDCLNETLDNGRVMSADYLTILVTEQDYITIKNNYNWEGEVEVLEAYKSKKEYLPRKFVEYVLELYANKTELKDVEGKEDLYMQSKQYINSLFGMMVTAILQADVILDSEGVWHTTQLTKGMVEDKLAKLRSSNPREKRYFLSYSWGCWVTAYARRNLWKCIETCDNDVVYCDTDSIFVIGEHDFSWYNKEITNKLLKACKEQKLDFKKTRPKTPKGKEKPLGIFDKEEPCIEFITLGAKRYCERREDGKLYLTISGINKGAVELLNNDIYNFKDGMIFDKDADCVTKRLCTYLTDMPKVEWNDGYISNYKYGINLRRNGYKLSITDEYSQLIEFMEMTLDDITPSGYNKIKGYF